MGKGDRKTAKGKRAMGSYGITRQRPKSNGTAAAKAVEAEPKKAAPKKEAKPKTTAAKKPAAKKTVKKED